MDDLALVCLTSASPPSPLCGPSRVEIHEPPWEQTTPPQSLVRGTERPLLSRTLETVLVVWTLTSVSCDRSEVGSFSSALYSFSFFPFCSPSPHRFFFFFSFAVSLAFVKSVGCMNLVRKKRALLLVAAFSPKENLVLWWEGWTSHPALVSPTTGVVGTILQGSCSSLTQGCAGHLLTVWVWGSRGHWWEERTGRSTVAQNEKDHRGERKGGVQEGEKDATGEDDSLGVERKREHQPRRNTWCRAGV